MGEPRFRVGVFLVPANHEQKLRQAANAIAAAMIGGYGELAPRVWYRAMRDSFDQLIEVCVFHRIVHGESASYSFADFVLSLDGRNQRLWGEASPIQRRKLAAKYLAKIEHEELRAAIVEALAQPAPPDVGLWIQSEAVPPSAWPDGERARKRNEDPDRDRREYLASPQPPLRVAHLCELEDEHAVFAAQAWEGVVDDDLSQLAAANDIANGRCLLAAVTRERETLSAMLDAAEELCVLASKVTRPLAGTIYDASHARELLAWLETTGELGTATRARDWVLGALRRAVKNGHAFAFVFEAL